MSSDSNSNQFTPSQLSFRCELLDWLAWAPEMETKQQWKDWALANQNVATKRSWPNIDAPLLASIEPSTTFLPLKLRKKLSGLTKISLWLAHHILSSNPQPGHISTVFASRHGESSFTVDLLNEICAALPLSPMAFSRSVHNTASGIFGIAQNNTASSTAIAAMHNTFEMGLLQAVSSLQFEERILYVMVDDSIPEDFAPYVNELWGKYGVALLLGRSSGEGEILVKHCEGVPTAVATLTGIVLGEQC